MYAMRSGSPASASHRRSSSALIPSSVTNDLQRQGRQVGVAGVDNAKVRNVLWNRHRFAGSSARRTASLLGRPERFVLDAPLLTNRAEQDFLRDLTAALRAQPCYGPAVLP